MKDETTIRFTKEMDAELMEIAEGTLEDAFGFGAFDDEEMAAIRNALRFAFDAGVDHANATTDMTALAFEDDGCVIKAMKAQMSPDTLEAIKEAIEQQLDHEDEDPKRQLEWLLGEIDKAL